MGRLVIHGGLLLTFIDEAYEAVKIQKGDIVVKDGIIKEIAREVIINSDDQLVDATGKLVIPGFINAHNHCLTTAVCRCMTDDYNREKYGGSALYSRVFPLKRIASEKLTDEEIASLLKANILEMLYSGTTTVLEQCTSERDMTQFISLAEEVGLRACVAPMFTSGKHHPEARADGSISIETVKEQFYGLEKNVQMYEEFDGRGNGRISIWLGPHAPESCTPELLQEVRKTAEQTGMRITIHAAQTRVEMEKIRGWYGLTPVEHLEKVGLLGPDLVVAHAIFTTAEDKELFKKYGVHVAHCPQVFAKGGIIAPFEPYKKLGVNVAIGTDTYSIDTLAEMRMAAIVGKLQTGNAHTVTATDVFNAATVGGAKALAKKDIGLITEGLRADLLVLDIAKPHIQPVAIPIINIIYHATSSDIETVIIDGKVIIEKGKIKVWNEDEVLDSAGKAVNKVWDLARDEGIL